MNHTTLNIDVTFLKGGGEMGNLTRNFDWSKTPIGTPDTWPYSLRTTVSNLLRSKFPMFLWWGNEMIQFYNDAYRPSMGNDGKHPNALGQKGSDCWPEIWPIISPMLDQVKETGEANWMENLLVPIYRNGELEDVYWTFSYSLVLDDEGSNGGILVTCMETTQSVISQKKLEVNQQKLLALFEESPIAIATLSSDESLTFQTANPFYASLVGRTTQDLLGKPLLEALPEMKGQYFDTLIKNVVATRRPYIESEVPADLIRNGTLETIYVNLTFQPRIDNHDKVIGILIIAIDVTQQVITRKKVEESEARFRSLIEQAPVATSLFAGRDLIIELANDTMIGYWGKGKSIIGRPLAEALPELKGQPFLKILDEVFTSGKAYEAKGAPAHLEVDGILGTYYFDFTYKPLFDRNGEVYGIVDMAIDVTKEVLAHQELEESQARLKGIFEQAPIALGLLEGREMIIKEGNDLIFEIWGKPRSVTGLKLMEALPELQDQPFLGILHQVYDTGKPFFGNGILAKLERNGTLDEVYFDVAYTAIRNSLGEVTSVLVVATDVTDRVLSKMAIEKSENKLQAIISAAPVAIGVFIGRDLIIENPNQTFIDILDKGPDIAGKPLREVMPELISEGQPFLKILDEVFITGVPFISPAASIKVFQNGELHHNYYNISYIPLRDDHAEVYAILEIALDVTEQVHAQQKITESEARFRTMAESTNVLIAVGDETGNATYFNKAWVDLTGKSMDDLLLSGWVDLIHPEDKRQYVKNYQDAFKKRVPFTGEFRISSHQGAYRWLLAEVVPRFNSENSFAGYISSCVDITERKEGEKSLEQKNVQLLRINNELDNFIYTASHDLKAPISNLEGLMNAYFGDYEITQNQKVIVDMMFGSIERFKTTIRDLTEISKVQQGYQDHELETLFFNDIFNEVRLDIRELFDRFKPVIETDFSINEIKYSRKDLRSIVYNLVSNALKYSSPDRVPELKISTLKTEGFIVLKVTDNGLGLSKENQSKLFVMFKRVHQHIEGSGIGLYMIKKMIENAGGTIELESEVGSGTTFTVYFKF